MNKVYLHGEIVEAAQARVSVFDRSYLFGEGLFETMRAWRGVVPFLAEHIGRLEWAAHFLGLSMPDPHQIQQAIAKLLQAQDLLEARVKVVISRSGGDATPLHPKDETGMVIFCEPITQTPDGHNKIFRLCFVNSICADTQLIASMKTTNHLTKVIARREIEEKSAAEGIFCDISGAVCEGASSNIFVVCGGKVLTPPPQAAILSGITRSLLMKAGKEMGEPIQEKRLTREDVLQADEIFITNSILGVQPVTHVDESAISGGACGPVSLRARSVYQSIVEKRVAALLKKPAAFDLH